MTNSKISLLALLAISLALPACTAVGVAAGAGATAGVAAAQDGGIEGALTDTRIRATINDLWFRYDLSTFAKLNLTIKGGRVLITGVVQKPEARVEAVRLAWQARGVKEVINEIRVAESSGITGFARDAWITTRLRAELTFERDVVSINYSIDTVQGTVYLMGVAQNQQELNRVTQIARTIPDVKQVVSYVRIRGENEASLKSSPIPADQMPASDNNGGMMNDPSYSEPYPDNGGGPVPLVPEPVLQEPMN